MLELIIGAKGNGKTRKMVERANNESKRTSGSIIYIDKSNKHMYELSNARVRYSIPRCLYGLYSGTDFFQP